MSKCVVLPGRSAGRRFNGCRRTGEGGPAAVVQAARAGIAQQGSLQAQQRLTQPALHGPQVAAPEGEQGGRRRGGHRNVLEI